MSYKNPTIPSLTLKGIDLKIQDIQEQMSDSLSWLDKAFGLADRFVKEKDGDYIFPGVFVSNKVDPLDMMPSDLYPAMSFWTKEPLGAIDNLDEWPVNNALMTYAVSCIFYMDIRQIDNTMTWKETKSKLREDILYFFANVQFKGKLVRTGIVDDDITLVYDGFSLNQIDNEWKEFPKWACRVNFELSFYEHRDPDECYTANTYNIT